MKIRYPFKAFFLFLLCLVLLAGNVPSAFGQQVTYGDEWINYNQVYYKIKVPATGMYRLSHAYLQEAGLSGVDPRNLQLFRRGQEVAMYVEGEADGTFDATDYIEFYGEKNDGALDRELYKNPTADHINPYYSLYTDTAAYFLTWSASPGKRMQLYSQVPTGFTPEPYHWQETILFDNGEYSRGKRYGENYMSWMDAGEGYTGGSTAGYTYNLGGIASKIFSGGLKPKVEIAFVGANDNSHEVEVFVKPPTGAERLVGAVTMVGYASTKKEFALETSDFFTDGKLVLRITAKNTASRFRTIYFKAIYPQSNVLSTTGTFVYAAQPSSPIPSYIQFEGSGAATAAGYDVSAPENVKRLAGTTSGNQKGFVFPASFSKGLIWTGTNLIPLPAKEVKFRSLVGNQANYLIITHSVLKAPAGSSANPVRDYAAYRASAAGGGYDTLTMEVDQIYNQFFYGDKSSAALRRYMKYMMAHGKPAYLLLLGKGLESDNIRVRNTPSALAFKDLVPTGGTPGSDVFFTADWENGKYFPQVATGRIPANVSGDVISYLNKVKLHEQLPQNLGWRKNILHLVGGIAGSEQNTLLSYMRSYENIAEGTLLGANVATKVKSTQSGLDTINIAKELNNGLSLLTFFGHSSPTTSDLDIGLVSNVLNGYKNEGKFPMILMNGCNAGNSFILSRSFGEDWLLTPEKGALAFLANDSYGYPSLLNVYSSDFYLTVFKDSTFYGKPIGDQCKEVNEKVTSTVSGSNFTAMIMQMVLQADPALVIVGPDKPDYLVQSGGVSIRSLDGNEITATSEKFALDVIIHNLGKVEDVPLNVAITRTLENGVEIAYDPVAVPPVYYEDTVRIELDSKTEDGSGINKFLIKVDFPDEIEELNETNNTAEFEIFISKSGVLAVGPQEYSIVSNKRVKLIGQSTNLTTEVRQYYFELDTTQTFKSPWVKNHIITAATLPTWEVTLPDNTTERDSVVYFWRLRYENFSSGEDTIWATSSFRYIPESGSGWSQAKTEQLAKASSNNLVYSSDGKKITFSPQFKTIEIKGGGGGHKMSREAPFGIFIDNAPYFWDNCGYTNPNILAIVFSDVTLDPYVDMPTGAGARCGLAGTIVYQFSNLNSASNQNALEKFLNSIPANHYVALVGINNIPYSSFKPSLKAAFNGVGSAIIDQLQTGDPFILLGQKGAAKGTALEKGANVEDPIERPLQTIQLEKRLQVNGTQGTMTSSLIGPAANWTELQYQLQKNGLDEHKLDIIGVNQEGKEVLLADNVESTLGLTNIDATIYPYLKLSLFIKDEEERTAPQLKQWTVLYEGVPEGLLRPDIVGTNKYKNETISEQTATGQVDLRFAYHNISDVSFTDSLTVETVLFLESGNRVDETFKVMPLLKGDTVFFNHSFSTLNVKGNSRLRVTVNPRILPEQIYTNNTLELPFTVGQFVGLPPTLDVVFDGNRILDGDIVSPSPVISVVLKDNAGKLPITDPTSVKVYLREPGVDFKEINVASDSRIKWFPADEKNEFRLEFNPTLSDGDYTLEVQGVDALGQRAGSERFSINFKVVNESSVTNFYPYPNPFSSKTRFVFTLTGNTVPEKMKVQIMTVTGKVIREIQKEELGPIKIGNNVTEFAWDGTDELGDRLANGVYLYRVVMDNGPEEMKHRFTTGDKAFKKEYGKLYILR